MAAALILPGQEALLAEIFGSRARIAGCRWLGTRVLGDRVVSGYAGREGSVVIACAVLERARAGALAVGRFGLWVQSGTAPPGLLDEIAGRLRAREAAIAVAVTEPEVDLRHVEVGEAALRFREGMRVLEVGTGNAAHLLWLGTQARAAGVRVELCGVDHDEGRAEPIAREAAALGVADLVRFELGDVRRLPPQLEGIDVLLCIGCMAHFLRRGDLATTLLSHWRTRLREGGVVTIADQDREAPDEATARAVALFEELRWPIVPAATLDEAFRATGFEIVRERRWLHHRAASREAAATYLEKGARGEQAAARAPAGERYDFVWRVVEARRLDG